MSNKYICIDPSEFDASRAVQNVPVRNDYTLKDGSSLSVTRSVNKYLNDNDEPVDLYIRAPEQRIGMYGVTYTFSMGTDEKDKKPELAEGMKLEYPMTSFKTIATPTPEEEAFRNVVDKIYELTCQHVEKMYRENTKRIRAGEQEIMPKTSKLSIGGVLGAEGSGNWKEAVKFPYAHQNKKGTAKGVKNPDMTKPANLTVKVATSGKKDQMKVLSKVYIQNGDEELATTAIGLVGRQGIITPVLKWADTFWGGHGDTGVGVSPKFLLHEASFEEIESSSSLPDIRFTPSKSENSSKSESGPSKPASKPTKAQNLDLEEKEEIMSDEEPETKKGKKADKKADVSVLEMKKPTKKKAVKKTKKSKAKINLSDSE